MWTAFEHSKTTMINTAELAHPVEEAELSLEVGASGTHVGAVLHQPTYGGKWRLGFFSVKQLSTEEIFCF